MELWRVLVMKDEKLQSVLMKRMKKADKKAVKRLNDQGDIKEVFDKDEYL